METFIWGFRTETISVLNSIGGFIEELHLLEEIMEEFALSVATGLVLFPFGTGPAYPVIS